MKKSGKKLWRVTCVFLLAQGYGAISYARFETQDIAPAHSETGNPPGLYGYKSPYSPQEPVEGTHGKETVFPVQGMRGPSFGEGAGEIGSQFPEQEEMFQEQGYQDETRQEGEKEKEVVKPEERLVNE